MKKYRFLLSLLFLLPFAGPRSWAQQQRVNVGGEAFSVAREMSQSQDHLGALEMLTPLSLNRWRAPQGAEMASYLEAIGRGALNAPDGENRLVGFIREYPHSALLPYAQMRLGQWYFVRELYQGAAYWFRQYDLDLIPEELQMDTEYYLGYSLLKMERYDEALPLFRRLRFAPEYKDEAALYEGYILLKKGDLEGSAEALTSLLSLPRYAPWALSYLSQGAFRQGQYSKAIEYASGALRVLEEDAPLSLSASLLQIAGFSHTALGARTEAVDYLQRYASMVPSPSRLSLLSLGESLYDLGKPLQALPYLSQVVGERDYLTQLALYYKGLSSLSAKDTEQALEAFSKAKEYEFSSRVREAATFNHALIKYSAHPSELGEGTKLLERYIQVYPSGEHRSLAITHLGDAYLNDKNIPEVLSSLSSLKPFPKELLPIRGRVKLRAANQRLLTGDARSASRAYEQIITSGEDPLSVAQAYFWQAELAYREGAYQKCIDLSKKYLQVRPKELPLEPNVYYNMGYAHYNLSQWHGAQEALLDYIKATPRSIAGKEENPSSVATTDYRDGRTAAFNRLGDLSVQLRKYPEAMEYYAAAQHEGGGESDYALFKQGMTAGLLKDYGHKARLLSLMEEKFKGSKYLPEAMYEQGRAFTMSGQSAKARQVYATLFSMPSSLKKGEDSEYTAALTRIAPKAGLQLGLGYFGVGDMKSASHVYEQVVRRYPKSEEAKSALQDLKSISVEMNRVDEYTRLLSEVSGSSGLALSGGEADSLSFLAAERVVAEKGGAEGRRALDRYLSKYPTGVFASQALYNKAYLLYKEKKYSEVVSTLSPVASTLKERRVQIDMYKLLGLSYEGSEELGRAAEAYLRLAQIDPSEAERGGWLEKSALMAGKSSSYDFLWSLVQDVKAGQYQVPSASKSKLYGYVLGIFAQQNRKEEALSLAQAILDLPDTGLYPRARVVKGLGLYDEGKYTEAKAEAEAVVSSGTSDSYWLARGFILLADIYSKQGDLSTARTYLESLRANYKEPNDGILKMVNNRISKL